MNMYMSDVEISTGYRMAKNKAAQVQILADLNAVPREAMEEKLRELGLLEKTGGGEPSRKKSPRPAPFDETRARELHAEGRDDLAISEMLGVSKTVFADWRREQGLAANYPKLRGSRRPRKAAEPNGEDLAGGALTVGRLAEIFGQMAQWHPDAVVAVPAGRLSHVRLVSEYGTAGEPLLRVELT